MSRIRITYTKSGPLRYTSNLDMHRIWERLMRRARLPLAYSQGFHPQPRINQASPLPLGMTSQVEMVEVWMEEEIDLDLVTALLAKAAPPGLMIKIVEPVDLHAPSLPTLVLSSEYLVTIRDDINKSELARRVANLLSSTEIRRDRRGKSYDLRPLVETMELISPSEKGEVRLAMRLSARESATGRPDEVLMALDLEPNTAHIERTGLIVANPS